MSDMDAIKPPASPRNSTPLRIPPIPVMVAVTSTVDGKRPLNENDAAFAAGLSVVNKCRTKKKKASDA
jgi:hypothetical protein